MAKKEMEEKVLLIGVKTQKNEETFEESMSELASLVETAGAVVVGEMSQNRHEIDRKTYIGKGKIEEVVQEIERLQVDSVIFNHELSPRQLNLLEQVLEVKVIDRVQLILDIFATRSTSKEGKLQVELAQLKYLSQRLSGASGGRLSRQGAGIGSRGPGETKLEVDRRHIKHQMSVIRKDLQENVAHRKRLRETRKEKQLFQIGLVGYTNAGKSTTLNLLTQAGTFEEDKLFATLDPLTKKWTFTSGLEVLVTDTVGFIQDLPTQLIEAFASTLEVVGDMDLLLHVVDASHPNHEEHEKTVMRILEELGVSEIPILTVYNKKDQITGNFVPTIYPYVLFSACKEEERTLLEEAVRKKLGEIFVPYDFFLPIEKSNFLHDLKRETILSVETYEEEENAYHVQGLAQKKSAWTNSLFEAKNGKFSQK